MYSFLGLGRHFRDVLRVGSKSRRPVRVFPSNFLGGGNSCSCSLGVQSHPPHSPPISPLGSMWRFRRKARSSACSDLTHHLHHPVLPMGSRGGLGERARARPTPTPRARACARACARARAHSGGSGRDRGGIEDVSGRESGSARARVPARARRDRGGIGE